MFSRAGGQPNALLVLADIKPGQMTVLQQRLDAIRDILENNHAIYFWEAKTVHFAAWIILPGVRGENGMPDGPAKLALETNYDGGHTAHLTDLVKYCRQALDDVYDCCEGYPDVNSRTSQSVQDFLCKQSKLPERSISSYYVAFQGRTREDIQNAIDVYEAAKPIVQGLPKSCTSNDETRGFFRSLFKEDTFETDTREALVAYFRNTPGAPQPVLPPFTQQKLNLRFFWTMVAALVFFPVTLLYALYWVVLALIARCFEETEQYGKKRFLPDPTERPPSFDRLDLGRQNHLCTYATVKPGRFRMWAMNICALPWPISVRTNLCIRQTGSDDDRPFRALDAAWPPGALLWKL